MKRLAVVASVLAAAFLVGAPVAAADGGATIETIPATFATLDSTTCSNLPAGTSITWSGTEKSITRTHTRGGVTTLSNITHAHGFAQDQDGNQYAFNYSNTFRVSNSAADPATFTGRMVDSFSLAGRGPAHLNNGFVANITTDLATFFTFDPLQSRGDPIDFVAGTSRCDPL